MAEQSHGFGSREAWTKLFLDYNLIISDLNYNSYALVLSDLPAGQWIARYRANSDSIRRAYLRNEAMLDRHIRWFTRTPERWTQEIADPLIDTLYRYVTRIQDLGTVWEIAQSLFGFYEARQDAIAVMKCRAVRAICCSFLDSIHLKDEIRHDTQLAQEIYERYFDALTPEEQSIGLTIYDIAFDQMDHLLKLGQATPALLEEMIRCHKVSSQAAAYVISVDQGYDFNAVIPDFDHYLGFAALCLSPGQCTPDQADAIYEAAARRWRSCENNAALTENYGIRVYLVYLMARRLRGQCSGADVLDAIRKLMETCVPKLLQGGSYDQHATEVVEALQLATENLTGGGQTEPELYHNVHTLFIDYVGTRPYTTFVDYVCATLNYCYICTAHGNDADTRQQLQSLLRLTTFRQVQTAMHSIMVGQLATAITDSLIHHRPELLTGQLETTSAAEVVRRRGEFITYIYCGALLHDIGKVLCSNVINAQSHRLGDLEFRVLKFHPVTGGEMLDCIPALSRFRDLAVGHQKSYDGAFGYPADFDNTASPQKIFIDIISICDSLDAATDHLGRNYATAKDFAVVMGELRQGRNTRYSGDIVDLIDSDPRLRERLRYLLEDGRRDVYYDVHKMIISQSAIQPGQRQERDWQTDLSLAFPDYSSRYGYSGGYPETEK